MPRHPLLTPEERDALTWAILQGDPHATPDDTQAIAAWAAAVRWQHLVLTAALAGHCGLRQGPDGVDVVGLTAGELLAREEGDAGGES